MLLYVSMLLHLTFLDDILDQYSSSFDFNLAFNPWDLYTPLDMFYFFASSHRLSTPMDS